MFKIINNIIANTPTTNVNTDVVIDIKLNNDNTDVIID